MLIGMRSAGGMIDDLARLVRPLMVACMGSLIGIVVCSASLARSAVFSKACGYVLLFCGRKKL